MEADNREIREGNRALVKSLPSQSDNVWGLGCAF